MNYKKILFIIAALCLSHGYMHSAFQHLFDARNVAVYNFIRKQEDMRKTVMSASSLLAAWGAFNYLRSKPGASDLACFGEAAAVATTSLALMKLGSEFVVDPLLKRLPPVRGFNDTQEQSTQELFNYAMTSKNIVDEVLALDVKDDQLGIERDMYAQLMSFIGNTTSYKWVEDARVKKRPNFYGPMDIDILRVIDEMKHPKAYAELGPVAECQAGIILAGPAGTGKTTLGDIITFEAGCVHKKADIGSFAVKYVGTGVDKLRKFIAYCDSLAIAAHEDNKKKEAEAERRHEWENRSAVGYLGWRLGKVAQTAYNKVTGHKEKEYIRKCIIQLDEGQGLLQDHEEGENSEQKRMVETLLQEIDNSGNHHVFFVITTNSGENTFREASLRRFGDKVVYVRLPEAEARFDILMGYLKDEKFRNFLAEDLKLNQDGFNNDVQYDLVEALEKHDGSFEALLVRLKKGAQETFFRDNPGLDEFERTRVIVGIDEEVARVAMFYQKNKEQLIYWKGIADSTKGFSGAAIKLCLSNALKNPTFLCNTGRGDERMVTRKGIKDAFDEQREVKDKRRKDLAKKAREQKRRLSQRKRYDSSSSTDSSSSEAECGKTPACKPRSAVSPLSALRPAPKVEIVDGVTHRTLPRYDEGAMSPAVNAGIPVLPCVPLQPRARSNSQPQLQQYLLARRFAGLEVMRNSCEERGHVVPTIARASQPPELNLPSRYEHVGSAAQTVSRVRHAFLCE